MKIYNDACGFSCTSTTPICTREIVIDIMYGVGASLIGRFCFWQDQSQFFKGLKRKFFIGANGHFFLWETCQWSRGNCWVYVAKMVLTNAHGFVAKTAILGNIFDKILTWQLTVPQREGIWEIKNNNVNRWQSDYIPTKFVEVGWTIAEKYLCK